jgi:hypothetical protein
MVLSLMLLVSSISEFVSKYKRATVLQHIVAGFRLIEITILEISQTFFFRAKASYSFVKYCGKIRVN